VISASCDISKKNVIMQIKHTHVINCSAACLQPHTLTFTQLATYSALVVKSNFGNLGYKSLCTPLGTPLGGIPVAAFLADLWYSFRWTRIALACYNLSTSHMPLYIFVHKSTSFAHASSSKTGADGVNLSVWE